MGNNLLGDNLPLNPDFLGVQYNQPTLEQITADEAAAGGGVLLVVQGGTGANNAGGARTNLSAAQSGANTDITSLTPTSITLGGGTAITKIRVFSQSLTPASVAANISAEEGFTVAGLTTADKVIVNGPAPTAGTGIVNARVSAADTLTLCFANFTAGALTPTSGTYLIVAVRS